MVSRGAPVGPVGNAVCSCSPARVRRGPGKPLRVGLPLAAQELLLSCAGPAPTLRAGRRLKAARGRGSSGSSAFRRPRVITTPGHARGRVLGHLPENVRGQPPEHVRRGRSGAQVLPAGPDNT